MKKWCLCNDVNEKLHIESIITVRPHSTFQIIGYKTALLWSSLIWNPLPLWTLIKNNQYVTTTTNVTTLPNLIRNWSFFGCKAPCDMAVSQAKSLGTSQWGHRITHSMPCKGTILLVDNLVLSWVGVLTLRVLVMNFYKIRTLTSLFNMSAETLRNLVLWMLYGNATATSVQMKPGRIEVGTNKTDFNHYPL